MIKFNYKSILSICILIGMSAALLVHPPQPVNATDGGGSKAQFWKEMVLDAIARGITNAIFITVMEKITEIVTMGPDDRPTWIRNFEEYRSEALDRGREDFDTILAEALFSEDFGTICEYFSETMGDYFGVGPDSFGAEDFSWNNVLRTGFQARGDSFSRRQQCTLPQFILD